MKRAKKRILVPVVILRTRSGFNGFSPSVPGCAVTGKTLDSTLEKMKSALEFHIEGEGALRKLGKKNMIQKLKSSFNDYGADAVYATVKIAA